MYIIEMQFIPNLDVAWVERLSPNDSLIQFETLEEAEQKSKELQDNDSTGRKYRVKNTN